MVKQATAESTKDNDTPDQADTRLSSWMKVFWANVSKRFPRSTSELVELIKSGNFYAVGKSHSYNGIQIVRSSKAIMFGDLGFDEIKYVKSTKRVTVGPSTTIEQLKSALVDEGRRLANSGNYMAQTVIGAMITGTHGYGPSAVMADSIYALEFLDAKGEKHRLKRGDAEFPYVALSFGMIAPIVSLTLDTKPLQQFQSDVHFCRMSERKAKVEGADSVSFAVLPYSDLADPTLVMHTIQPAKKGAQPKRRNYPLRSFKWLAEFFLRRLWAIDRMFPILRRPAQRFIAAMSLDAHQRKITEKTDLDYLYDPDPMTASQRAPHLIRGIFSTTHTAYNLAFFVELDLVDDVIKFIMKEADSLRDVGFYLKSTIGVRELPGKSELPFAGNFNGPVAAIDIFSDRRDYAWLERIQSEVLQYFPRTVRPHWGKSAIVRDFADALSAEHISTMREIHMKYFPYGSLMINPRLSRLFGFITPPPGSDFEQVELQSRGL